MPDKTTTNFDWPSELPALLRRLLLPTLAATIGGVVTGPAVRTWYPTLKKPSFNPPNQVFGPVWTLLYLLMGIADYIVGRTATSPAALNQARTLYHGQLALNTGWSLLFFGRRSPLAGLLEIVCLWLAIVLTIRSFAQISRPAALLLVPYLLWVTFATLLNGAIWQLNR